MRLPGRLSAAIEVLNDIEQRKRPVADALKDWACRIALPAQATVPPSAILFMMPCAKN